MLSHSKTGYVPLPAAGPCNQRAGRDGPHARKLPALRLLPVVVVRSQHMKFHAAAEPASNIRPSYHAKGRPAGRSFPSSVPFGRPRSPVLHTCRIFKNGMARSLPS